MEWLYFQLRTGNADNLFIRIDEDERVAEVRRVVGASWERADEYFDQVYPHGWTLAGVIDGENAMAEIEKGQQLAGHFPGSESLDLARRILIGDTSSEQARDEILAKYRS